MIPLFVVHVPPDASRVMSDTLYSGYLTEGPRVKEFEAALGAYIGGGAQVVAVNSCTSALTLALRVAGVGPGDEVVTTPMTCAATNLPILSLGARPVWADVNPVTGLIDSQSVAEMLAGRPKAVLCVDWGGLPCDLYSLLGLTRAYDVPLIEDAAHSLGAKYQGQRVGNVADITAFSFQAIKHITTGDGGALSFLAPSQWNHYGVAYKRAKLLRWFGIDREAPMGEEDTRIHEDINEWGWKFHMNDLTAALGLAQLPYLREVLRAHRQNAMLYTHFLPDYFLKPVEPPGVESAWWLYTVLLPSAEERDAFGGWMRKEQGIQVSRVHRRNDEYRVFAPYRRSLPGLDSFSNRMICLPVHWKLKPDERDRIISACHEWAEVHS